MYGVDKFIKDLIGFEMHPDILNRLIEEQRIYAKKTLTNKEYSEYKPNLLPFDEDIYNSLGGEGFDWLGSQAGHDFWTEILKQKKFNVFYTKYPKTYIPVYHIKTDTLMEVANNPAFIASTIRVVFSYKVKLKLYLAWSNATTLEVAENIIDSIGWEYAKPVDDLTIMAKNSDLLTDKCIGNTKDVNNKINELLNDLQKKNGY